MLTIDESTRARLADVCRKYRVRRLSLFGSALTDRFGPESDIDLLAEFEPDAQASLFDVGALIHELTEMFGRDVDVRTPKELSRYFRADVLAQAEPLYDRG